MTAITTARPLNGTVFAIITLITVLCLSVGVSYPLLSVELDAMGYSKAMNGLNAAMTPLGMVVCAVFIGRVSKKFPAHVFLLACIAVMVATMLAFKLLPNFYAWMVLRFVLGMAINGIHIVGEPALQAVVPANLRGRIMGVFSGVTVLGYAMGPTLLSVTGNQGWLPYVAAAVLIAMGALPLLAAGADIPNVAQEGEGEGTVSALSFAKVAPALLLAFGAVAIYDNVTVAFMPLYGAELGLTQTEATRLLTVAMIGAVIFQLPIGWLADRFSATYVMIGCGGFVAAACQFLPTVGNGVGLWVLCFLIGGVAFGLQTAVLTELSNRFSGNMLVAGNVAIGMMAGGASMVGMPATGATMEMVGANGYPMVIGAVFAGIALLYAGKALRGTVAPAPANAAQAA